MFCAASALVNAAQKKVLFYGHMHAPGGVAETLVNSTPAEFFPIGGGSDIWTPGDANPAKDWNMKIGADFAAFDAIVIGDPGPENVNPDPALVGAIMNNSEWTPAISGNVVIIAGDPEHHPGAAAEYIQQGLRFASEHPAPGPGLYVASARLDPNQSPIPPHDKKALAHLLEGFGSFSIIDQTLGGGTVTKIGSHPTLDCVTAEDLSGWGTSAHDGFADWPASFVPWALVAVGSGQPETPPAKLPPGYRGMVHILVKPGPGTIVNQLTLSPLSGCHFNGEQHTVTAKYVNQSGAGISGAEVTFTILSGPNANLGPAVFFTDGNGNASWTYTGNGGTGMDIIKAVVTTPAGCDPEARATAHWSSQMVTINATDASATEPPAQDTGTFVIMRSASPPSEINQPLTVTIAAGGTAQKGLGLDYTLDDSFGPIGNNVFFDAGQTTATLTLVPQADGLAEIPETAVVQLVQLPACPYVVGTPSEGTVTINSPHPTVTIALVNSQMQEAGGAPGKVRLDRTGDTTSALQVWLGFPGTATYGADYQVDLPGFSGVATIPSGFSFLEIPLIAVPDSRAEGNESVTVSVYLSLLGLKQV